MAYTQGNSQQYVRDKERKKRKYALLIASPERRGVQAKGHRHRLVKVSGKILSLENRTERTMEEGKGFLVIHSQQPGGFLEEVRKQSHQFRGRRM